VGGGYVIQLGVVVESVVALVAVVLTTPNVEVTRYVVVGVVLDLDNAVQVEVVVDVRGHN
jgi:hypothetical protein